MKPNQLSKTAAYIAIKFYGITLTEPYRSLFDKETIRYYDHLVANLPFPLNKYHSYLKNKWFRNCLKSVDEFLLPGDLMHILMRKYYMSKMVNELIDQNYKQLIVLGAGFDHLGKAFADKGLNCFELDVPRMAQLKLKFLQKFNYHDNRLTVFPAHFSESSLYDFLTLIPNLDSRKKTIIAAEGFFDYLTPKELKGILNNLSWYFNNRVTLISTLFALDELTLFHSFIFKSAVAAVGEELKLYCSQQEFDHILTSQNYQVEVLIPGETMRREKLMPLGIDMPVLPGFYLVKAGIKKGK